MLIARFVSCFAKEERSSQSRLSVNRGFLGFRYVSVIQTYTQCFSPNSLSPCHSGCTRAGISSLLARGVQSSCREPSLKCFSPVIVTKTCYWYADFSHFCLVLVVQHQLSVATLQSKDFLPWYPVGGLTWIVSSGQGKDDLSVFTSSFPTCWSWHHLHLFTWQRCKQPDTSTESVCASAVLKVCCSDPTQILKWSWVRSSPRWILRLIIPQREDFGSVDQISSWVSASYWCSLCWVRYLRAVTATPAQRKDDKIFSSHDRETGTSLWDDTCCQGCWIERDGIF